MDNQTKEKFSFTADQIGSEILTRFSEDIYRPKAIIRELVKNAFDSYFQLESHLEKTGHDLDIDITVKVDVASDSLIISDQGLGLDRQDFERLVSIALTEKRDIPGVTGYRGIGFWSAYSGGDAIVVQSTKFGSDRQYELRLDTRKMRQLQGPHISIGRIMNEAGCMQLLSSAAREDAHFTRIIIVVESSEGRLRSLLLDPDILRKLLLEGCSCGLAGNSDQSKRIRKFYSENRIKPLKLLFQGKEVVRDLPSDIGDLEFSTLTVEVGRKKIALAKVWHITNTKNARLDAPLAGLRICREGFPIGSQNPYSRRSYADSNIEITRADLLNWHIGEVHLVHEELLPDASGEDIRDTEIFTLFREKLRELYRDLDVVSRTKQQTESLREKYRKDHETVVNLAKKTKEGTPLSEADKKELAEITKRVERDSKLGRTKLKDTATSISRESLVRDEQVKKTRRNIAKILKDFDTKPVKATAGKSSKVKKEKPQEGIGTVHEDMTSTINDVVQKSSVFALFDELRDAVMEILADEPSLRSDVLSRINDLVKKL